MPCQRLGNARGEMTDEFGCLPFSGRVVWSWGAIEALPEQQERWVGFSRYPLPGGGGIILPPIEAAYASGPSGEEEVPGTRRTASLYTLPVTHRVTLTGKPPTSEETSRYGLLGFVVLFFGFLLGLRTQFAGWRVAGASPSRSHVSFVASPREAARCIELARPAWDALGAAERTILLNVLSEHHRAHGLDWDWDRFLHRYMLVDACYRIHRGPGRSTVPQREQWALLAERCGIPREDDHVRRLVDLRNELFHEALWSGYPLGHGAPADAIPPDLACGAFLERVVLGLLQVPAGVIGTPWWDRRQRDIELPPEARRTSDR